MSIRSATICPLDDLPIAHYGVDPVHILQEHAYLLATKSAEQKIAGALLSLKKRAGVQTAEGIEIPFPVTRLDISQMSGTTIFTVSRALKSWHKAGALAGGRRRIVIRDISKITFLR